jgi:hypothetical protein
MNLRFPALAAALVAGCSSTTTLPAGGLSEPVLMAVAAAAAGDAVFIGDATSDDLRVYLPGPGLFVRGPNAVSPLSIPLGLRPTAMASGRVQGPAGPLGWVAVAGPKGEVALVDAQTYRRTRASSDDCTAGGPAPSCLPFPVAGLAAAGDKVVASLGGVAAAQLATFRVSVEQGAPVLTLESLDALEGTPGAVALSSTGDRAWVVDPTASLIRERRADGTAVTLATASPARKVVPSPAWEADDGALHPAGEYLLVLLADGRLQTLDPAKGGAAADPRDATKPLAPVDFGVPVRDLVFVPCEGSKCRTPLRYSTSSLVPVAALGFAALGDGTAAPVAPDAEFPQVYRPLARSWTGPSATPPVLTVPGVSPAPASPTVAEVATTAGVTRSEGWTLTWQGLLPSLTGRHASLSGNELADASLPFVEAQVRVGDVVTLTHLGGACGVLSAEESFPVVTVEAGRLVLDAPRLTPAGCNDVSVAYRVQAGATAPWVVYGSTSRFVGRTAMGADAPSAPLFTVVGRRAFEPPSDAATGKLPDDGPALAFKVVGTTPDRAGTTLSFTTSSGLTPFIVGSEGLLTTGGGLAEAVAATVDRLFIAQVATGRFVEVVFGQLGATGAVRVLQ